jgi:hypothetical protein
VPLLSTLGDEVQTRFVTQRQVVRGVSVSQPMRSTTSMAAAADGGESPGLPFQDGRVMMEGGELAGPNRDSLQYLAGVQHLAPFAEAVEQGCLVTRAPCVSANIAVSPALCPSAGTLHIHLVPSLPCFYVPCSGAAACLADSSFYLPLPPRPLCASCAAPI